MHPGSALLRHTVGRLPTRGEGGRLSGSLAHRAWELAEDGDQPPPPEGAPGQRLDRLLGCPPPGPASQHRRSWPAALGSQLQAGSPGPPGSKQPCSYVSCFAPQQLQQLDQPAAPPARPRAGAVGGPAPSFPDGLLSISPSSRSFLGRGGPCQGWGARAAACVALWKVLAI